MEKIKFKEILKKNGIDIEYFRSMVSPDGIYKNYAERILDSMKEACEQILELASKEATIVLLVYGDEEIVKTYDLGQEVPTEREEEYFTINKESILKLKNQIEI